LLFSLIEEALGMLNLQRLKIEHFSQELQETYLRMYSGLDPQFGNIIVWTARLALENIANSDALYHNLDHTVMVGLAGQSILEGKHYIEGGVTPKDWLHFMIALLCHDIGYVRGVCNQDEGNVFATGLGGEMVELEPGGTDIALTLYHVDRSKLFVTERFGENLLAEMEDVIDAKRICSLIELTRFPVPEGEMYKDTKELPGLTRAADFIGQLGDPNYLRKSPALFYEFEETGSNAKYGYTHPGDLRASFAKFYYNVVSPYLKDALVYLNVTQEGKQWITNLNAHVFASERDSMG
jgi:hypothetical protein